MVYPLWSVLDNKSQICFLVLNKFCHTVSATHTVSCICIDSASVFSYIMLCCAFLFFFNTNSVVVLSKQQTNNQTIAATVAWKSAWKNLLFSKNNTQGLKLTITNLIQPSLPLRSFRSQEWKEAEWCFVPHFYLSQVSLTCHTSPHWCRHETVFHLRPDYFWPCFVCREKVISLPWIHRCHGGGLYLEDKHCWGGLIWLGYMYIMWSQSSDWQLSY